MNRIRKPFTVLVADDDDDDRSLIRRALDKGGVVDDLRFVKDGEELTDYLNRAGRYSGSIPPPRPGLILLDLNMPRKDGREALREIKANPELRQIPVVVLTTSRAEEDINRSYELGASSYIGKPNTFGALVDALNVVGEYWTDIVPSPPGDHPSVIIPTK